MKRLVLLDIDGTILHGGKLWKECFEESFQACGAGTGKMPRISFSGKTDRQICRELLQAAGRWPAGPAHGTEQRLERLVDAIIRGYLDRARARIPARSHEIRLMPGIPALITELRAHPRVTLGLLTGNVREGADLKLGSVGLGAEFKLGVFGDDHWDRYKLPAIAVARAHSELQLEVAGKQVVIIGDTIHDIGCGQEIGARAIGVGTGHPEARARVQAAWQGTAPGDPRPDHYFDDLGDLARVMAAILG